jgi:hypothetical protein
VIKDIITYGFGFPNGHIPLYGFGASSSLVIADVTVAPSPKNTKWNPEAELAVWTPAPKTTSWSPAGKE